MSKFSGPQGRNAMRAYLRQKQEEAEVRRAAREQRTAQEQLDVLDNRGEVATSERESLDQQISRFGKPQKPGRPTAA